MTCSYKGSINVAVLEGTGSFTEGKVLNLNVIIFNAIGFQNLTGISFSTGACSTYGNAFTLEISNRFDASFCQGYDLYGFRIQSCQTLQAGNLFALEHFGAINSIVSNIILQESNFYLALTEQVYVSYRSTGGLCGSISTRNVFVQDISQGTAQREVGTRGTTSSDINEFLCSRFFVFFLVSTAAAGNHSCHNHDTK